VKLNPQGKATGIGSLPFKEAEPALELIFKTFPEIPHWPQLPRRSKKEHFIFQNLAALNKVGLLKITEEEAYLDHLSPAFADQLTEFYSYYLAAMEDDAEALNFFRFEEEAATGFYAFLHKIKEDKGRAQFLKGQIVGPLSAGLNLVDAKSRLVYYEPQLRDVLVKTLALQAKWQIAQLKKWVAGTIIFVDDPGIYAVGVSTYISLKREEVVESLREIADTIKLSGAIAGAHACAGVDWSIFLEAGYEVLALDAYSYFNSLLGHLEQLHTFLKAGGILGLGVVPTSSKITNETEESLYRLLEEEIAILAAKGIEEELLFRQLLLVPSCGTGILEEEEAKRVYDLTSKLSQRLKG